MAVATGIAEGLGLGFNSRAALITRGLAEMTRLGVALGAQPATFAGLAGLGDLVLTCTGALSRNRARRRRDRAGRDARRGAGGKETVAEGVATTRERARARRRARESRCRSSRCVHRILFDGHPARRAVAELMTRELRAEQDA